MRRLVTPLLLVLLPLAVFFAFFHAGILDIGNPGWLIRGQDNGENALGLHAYRYDPHAGASLRTTLLNAPDGVPVLYTDSNPLVTLAAKVFSPLLPADAQLVGPFILLCLILQTLFAWLLLRRHAPGPLALWIGVILLAFPPTLANRFVHANLMAHWTILAALWLFLNPDHGTKLRWWAPLIAITALIHSYLLIMVGAIWASAMMVQFIAGPARARVMTLAHGAAILVLVAALAKWLGVGDQAVAGNFGAFSMPLDALWNPAIDSFSRLLPGHERSPGRGFEGFQYLGAGGLLLVLGAIAIAWRMPAREPERAVSARLRGLVPALIVLAILAVARLHLPEPILAVLDPVRASGRLFWPVGYVLILMAVLALYRLPRDRAGLALAAILAIQIADVSTMADAVRAQTATADHKQLYVRTVDPRWDALIRQSRSIAFMPTEVTHDLALFQEIAWRAAKLRRPITSVYAARTSRATTARRRLEESAYVRGQLVPGRLYILLPSAPLPKAGASRAMVLDGVTVIAPSAPR